MIQFEIISIFPEAFASYFSSSILARAQKKKQIALELHNLRDFTTDKHQTVDDRPYGGGPGMVLKVEPIYKAVRRILQGKSPAARKKTRVILLSAKGKQFTQQEARRLAKYRQLILICGHYEGVDERVAEYVADEELSIGEFVLTGGELPAMLVVDAVSRLVPGVLGKEESLKEESFSQAGYREYPHYTRPEVFEVKIGAKVKKLRVPKILLSGDHKQIASWRKEQSS